MQKEERDELKFLIAAIATIGSNVFPLLKFEGTDDAKEKEQLKMYLIILIRMIIIFYSITYDWPLLMCATISGIISFASNIEIKI